MKSSVAGDQKNTEECFKSQSKVDVKVKCKYENTGNCKIKRCKDIHPKKTCQGYSKLGSCAFESNCEHRHPYGVCYSWEREGFCNEGDECRHRHPFLMSAALQGLSQDNFLGHGRREKSRSPDRRSLRYQGQRHSRRRSR